MDSKNIPNSENLNLIDWDDTFNKLSEFSPLESLGLEEVKSEWSIFDKNLGLEEVESEWLVFDNANKLLLPPEYNWNGDHNDQEVKSELVLSESHVKVSESHVKVSESHVKVGEKMKVKIGRKRKVEVEMEEIQKHFHLPITKAAKEMKIGLTVLKKRCRELNIMRWPHRKIKSLKSLIHSVKEMGLNDEIEMLEEQKSSIEKVPDLQLDYRTKRLRQTCFKANYNKKRHRSG